MSEDDTGPEDRWLRLLAVEEKWLDERVEQAIRAVDAGDTEALKHVLGCSLEEAREEMVRLSAPSREERDAWLFRWVILARLPEIS